MIQGFFVELSLIMVLAVAIASIMRLLRQPLIIGYIISGLLLGPYLFDAIHSEQIFDMMSHLGIALLLFIIGLGLNPRAIKGVGKPAALVGLGQVIFTTIVGFFVAQGFGFTSQESIYIAMALTLSSTVVILKVLTDKEDTGRLYGKIAMGFFLVQDIVAAGFLVYVTSASTGDPILLSMGISLGWLMIIGCVLYLVAHYLLPRVMRFFAGSQEHLFLFAVAWGFGVATIVALTGMSIEIGALMAGVALSTQVYVREISTRLRPLRDFFIVLFFIMLGTGLDFGVFHEVLWPAIGLSLFVLIGNPLIVLTLMGYFGYTKRTSFKTAMTVAQISEFSLVFIILAVEHGQVGSEIVSLVTMVALLTIAGSVYMMQYDDQLFEFFKDWLDVFERKKVKFHQEIKHQPEIFLFGYARGGHELVNAFRRMEKDFLVVDYDPEAIEHLKDEGVTHDFGDITDPEFLNDINVDEADLIVSTISDFKSNLYLTEHIHRLNPEVTIIVYSEYLDEAALLYESGASHVMMPHYVASERMINMIVDHTTNEFDFVAERKKHLQYIQERLI